LRKEINNGEEELDKMKECYQSDQEEETEK